MSATALIGIVIAALAIGGVIAWYVVARRHQTQALHEHYGSEYDRMVARGTSRRATEADLLQREERVEHFDIHSLTVEQRELYTQQWHDVQEAFVDNPGRAVSTADNLIGQVMQERGYPVSDFEQRAADLSVHHAVFVENYRAARDIAKRHRRHAATTEELRRAMVYYREMFADLLQPDETLSDRQVSRAVEREVPVSSDRSRQLVDKPIERSPIAPPRSDREAR
jgi:hypothetical protein